jgi:PA14 domain-containing protein/thrombospondin type 3 repeat protein
MNNIFWKAILVLLVAVSFTTSAICDELPTVPDNLQAFKITFSRADVYWHESTDDFAVTGYKVYRSDTLVATVTEPSFTDTNLVPGTSYTYKICAVDTANQLSAQSLPLTLKTLESLDIDDSAVIEQVVDNLNTEGLSAENLISTVQSAFAALGYDSTFDKVDVSLLTELVQQRIDEMSELADPETPESRVADQLELDNLLIDNFEGNSFLELYTHSNLTELGEKHFQNGNSPSAIIIYEYSLNFLDDVEVSTSNTLHRLSHIKLKAITEATTEQEMLDILHDSKATLIRFFDFFPGSTSHIGQGIYVKAAFNYFWRFPELLNYYNYNQDIYDGALTMIQAAKAIDDSAMNAIRLDRMSAWELSNTTVAIKNPSGTPLTGEIKITNVSDTSRYPEDPVEDVRVFPATAASTLTPLYLGHAYDFTVKVDVQGGNQWVWNLSNVPHEKGKKVTYDHGTGPVITDLADSNAPAEIVVISSQPTAPYNLSADRFIDTFTLSWDWVSPSGFNLKEFKIFRSGTAIATVTAQTKIGIPLEIGDNTYSYTVIAYDTNDTPSSTSQALIVTPDFTDEQQAYFDWLQLHFGSGPVYDFEDADGDGLSNYFEFLLGSDPNLAPVLDVKATITDAVPGLFAEYYQVDSTIYWLPAFDSLTPVSSEVLTNFNFSANAGNILGSGISDYAALRLQGYIDVPADGRYRFYLNSDDGSELYIDGERIVDNDGRHSVREYSGDLYMRAGVHSVEIQYYEYTGSGTLEIDWNGPGFSRTALDSTSVWYTPNPTPLLAESLAQNRDSDNDGIIDMIEYQLGTDIHSADSDSDGISDFDEINITNTDPLDEDSDGDGFSDFDEVFLLFSDPNVADVSNTVTEVLVIDGSAGTVVSGEWQVLGSAIFANGRNGSLQYTINIPVDGVYRLEVEATENNSYSTNSLFILGLTVDDTYVGKTSITAPYGTNGTGHFYLPNLTSGNHTFTLKWDNVVSNTFIQINVLRLQALGGPDNDGNGIPDWIDNRLEKLTQLTVPAASPVSPVCVEGENQLNIGTLAISGYYTEPEEDPVDPTLKPAPDNTWYADVTISPVAATVLSFDFQNGSEIIPKTVTWTETNAMLEPDTMIRLNDSLLITGFPEAAVAGTSVITVDGEQFTINYDVINSRNSIAYKFENPGEYTVSVTYTPDGGGDPVAGSMEVKVVSSYFATAPVAILNKSRSWLNPNITTETFVKADSYINMYESDIQPTGRDLDLNATQDKTGYVVARLGEDGPVMDSEKIEVMKIEFLPTYKVEVIESFADGSVMIENHITLSHVPEDLMIHIRIFVGGHTFEDGTIEMWVTAADFDEFGVFKYRIIRSAGATSGVCHRVNIYQDDVLLQTY